MSRTRHHHHQRRSRLRYEVWSRRCPLVSGDNLNWYSKRRTHRYERRMARIAIRREVARL